MKKLLVMLMITGFAHLVSGCSPELTSYEKKCIKHNERAYRILFIDCLKENPKLNKDICKLEAVKKTCYQEDVE